MILRLGADFLVAVLFSLWAGRPGWPGFVIGLAVGFVIVSTSDLAFGRPNHGRRLLGIVHFAGYFLAILIRANLQIAREILTPGFNQTPRIVRYPVQDLDDLQVTVLANCITLTPGTLVVDASEDGHWLYVHCMYAEDRAKAIDGLQKLDDRLRHEVFSW